MKNKRKIKNGRRKEAKKDLYIYGTPWSYFLFFIFNEPVELFESPFSHKWKKKELN